MTDFIRNVLKYGEQRRTLYLNAHNKDDYGRHRGHVLYGMTMSAASGTAIAIAPGAVYTSQGLRIFFEVTDGLVDLGPAGLDVFNPSLQSQYPVCAMVFLRYEFEVAQVAQAVEATTAINLTSATLQARLVPYDRHTCAPAYHLRPRHPITLDPDDLPPSSYPSLQNWNDPSIDTPTTVNPQEASVQFGEVPIGYVLIGVDPATGNFPTSLAQPGVSIVSYKNVFEAIGDIIGQDPLLPIQPKKVVAGLVQAVTGQALRQGYSANVVGSGNSPNLQNPHYGTPEPGTSATRADSEFDTYRLPNFLKDGESILEALRRMDVVLRQWMNRTGSQDLVSIFQDGGGLLPAMATLDEILAKADGGLNAASNVNAAAYPTGASGADPIGHVLKDGLIPHVESSLTAKLSTTEGDSHKSALTALDIAIWVIITKLLGESVPRSELRDATGASFTPTSYDERPEGRPDQAAPTFSGAASSPYLTTQALRAAIAEAANRTLATPGINWLANANFVVAPTASGTHAALPAYWAINGTGSWNRTNALASRDANVMTVTLDPTSYFDQSIVGASADNFIGQALRSASYLSASATVKNTGANPIVVEVIGYSDLAGTLAVFSMTSEAIAGSATEYRNVTLTSTLTTSVTVNHVRFRIRASNTAQTVTFAVTGAALNAGTPISNPSAGHYSDFVSRDGGPLAQLRDHLYFGGKNAKNLADGVDPQDAVTMTQHNAEVAARTAADTSEANTRAAADAALQAAVIDKFTNMLVFSSAFTIWTVPAGVTKLKILCWGGGGGSNGGNNQQSSGGGGGGGFGMEVFTVTPGHILHVTVGLAATAVDGNDSFVLNSTTSVELIRSTGGKKGQMFGGGLGGTSTAAFNIDGQRGGYGNEIESSASAIGGEGGASPWGGAGGVGGVYDVPNVGGTNGIEPGGGGGGGDNNTTGAKGRVLFMW